MEEFTKRIQKFDNSLKLNLLPLAWSVSVLYACMSSPVLYAMRHPPSLPQMAWVGIIMAWGGALIEACADMHKYLKKRNNLEGKFEGPTGGLFSLVRHPNYLGEILFWTGLFVGGLPSFVPAQSFTPWVCSGLGLYGICFTMIIASKRLDEKQADKYKGQEMFELWKERVRWSLLPFVQ